MKPATHQKRDVAVAIIGLAGRFPGARNVTQYWQNLCAGVESLTLASDQDLLDAGVPASLLTNPSYVRAGGVVEDAESFDASFFGFGAREAEIIDPQQRVFLECAWEALEDAGCDPRVHNGPVGVFAGSGMNTYGAINLFSNPELLESVGPYQVMLGNDKDFLATRVAYKLNLKGPAINVQTACSTSLVAVQMAFESLLRGECEMALAGGVSIQFPQNAGYMYMPGMILSPDGHCRAFDADAAGTVPGRGAGVVVLKLLSDAVRDNDRIYAVIRGAAINNDGAAKVGYSAPSIEGQSLVIRKSIEMAGFTPESIRYVEAHGTGTEVGDPIEVAALTEAFGECAGERQFCGLGSVKPNIGHLDTAAGVVGLIKAALTLHHRMIPPTLHFKRPNAHIDFAQTPFYVNTKLTAYEGTEAFRAGVSSFGIGGTNAHVSLEEWREPQSRSNTSSQLIALSARSTGAIDALSLALATHLEKTPDANLSEVAYTLQTGRHSFAQRRFVIAKSIEDLKQQLQTVVSKNQESEATNRTGVVFLFTGQGSQYINMGLGLYQSSGAFRDEIDRCAALLEPHLGLDLRTVLYPKIDGEEAAQHLLNQTWITQPALFTIEYATAMLWKTLGIEPEAMLGHSVGEYVAACIAGVFPLEDALALIAARGRLIQSLPEGAMLAIPLAESVVLPLLSEGISIAAANSRKNTVVSGTMDAISAFEQHLQTKQIASRRLRTSHAFHSAMMEPALAPFRELVAKIHLKAPSIPYVSNLTGRWITASEATSPDYWVNHLRNAVRFADCAEQLHNSGHSLYLEAGPGETLLTLLRDHLGREAGVQALSSIRHPLKTKDDREHWLEAVGQLWLTGASIHWDALYENGRPCKTSLPSYPFERQRYWISARAKTNLPVATGNELPGKTSDIADWFYLPSWKRSVPVAQAPRLPLGADKACLLFVRSGDEFIHPLLQAVEPLGHTIRVLSGSHFQELSATEYQINPAERGDYTTLLNKILANGKWPERIVHAYALGEAFQTGLDSSLDYSIFSLMYLAQTISDISSTRTIELNVLTRGGFDVFGDGECDPKSGMLSGFCNVLPIDCPNIGYRLIDLDFAVSADVAQLQLKTELASNAGNSAVAWRGSNRWIPSYDALHLPANLPLSVSIPAKAVFLITGGLGGIGLAWARYLASKYEAQFVITSRNEFPEPHTWPELLTSNATPAPLKNRIQAIEMIRELGGNVIVVTADVSNSAQMQHAVHIARTKFGGLFGIIHAAGIPGVGMLQSKSRADAMAVLSPKVHGVEWILPLIHEQHKPGLVMLCSSISAIAPSIGLTDYGAANAYLDSFALANDDPKGTRVLAQNWDAWSESGMAVDFAQRLLRAGLREDAQVEGISDQDAADIFSRLLSYPTPQVVISTRNLNQLLKYIQSVDQVKERISTNTAATLHPRPALTTEYIEAADETELALVAIWQDLLGIDHIGTQDNFFQLGGHSLLGTQMMARIRERFGIDLPLRMVFEAPTPSQMATLVRTIPWASGAASSTPTLDQEREEIEL
ncbi:type I polyketide synthase [Acidicapsa ligni]|uniref:type I polyketide synthase n=1 Tax=Acidicapsa ligni TaxID=542300 RepID=UPI0021DFB05A|nr:type I polyketide synthase [Acidicapsa ligni]